MAGWLLVGIIVAGVEKALGRDAGPDTVSVAVAGAVAGAFVGQTFGWFVFGEPLGFLCSAAAAELLLYIYRARHPTRSVGGRTSDPPRVTAPLSAPSEPQSSAFMRVLEACAWGVPCAMSVAAGGLFGQLVGARIFPQQYEQIPSFLFFAPLGLVLGFAAGTVIRLARPFWGAPAMFAAVLVAALVYAGLMFDYSRGRAVPSQLRVTFEPSPAIATPCEIDCAAVDPPLQWSVRGTMRVQETAGLGGSIDYLEIYSAETHEGRHVITRDEAAELNRFRGPLIQMRSWSIPGTRRVRPGEIASIPIHYSYRTRNGTSERTIVVSVRFTDGAGRLSIHDVNWQVR